MTKLDGLAEFLSDYPGMSLKPTRNDETRIQGQFHFKASHAGEIIRDNFELDIIVHRSFPKEIPEVREIKGKIPKTGDYHVNSDGTLCLGSHLRLKKELCDTPNLVSFVEKCIVPYLFAVSIKLSKGGKFINGELAHGTIGIIRDYMDIFGLSTTEQVIYVLELLGTKKSVANKKRCPCGCGLRLGQCQIHYQLNAFRLVAPRSWFSKHAKDVEAMHFG